MKRLLHTSLAIFFFIGLVACGASDKPEKTTEAFFQYISAKQFEKAVNLIYLGDLKDGEMTTAKDKLTMMLKASHADLEKLGGFKSIDIKDVKLTEDGKKATVSYVIHLGKKDDSSSMRLIKVDNQWKISMK